MHTCCCISFCECLEFIKDFKKNWSLNLKMDLENCRKRKRKESFFSPSLLEFRPAGFPSAGPVSPSAAQLPLLLAWPAGPFLRAGPAALFPPSARAQPRAARKASAQHRSQPSRRAFLAPTAADRPAPLVGTVPFPAWLGNRPRPALQQPPPTTGVVGASPPLLGPVK